MPRQALFTVGGMIDHMALFAKALHQISGGLTIIFNDQNTHK